MQDSVKIDALKCLPVPFSFGIAEGLKKEDAEKQETVGSAAVHPVLGCAKLCMICDNCVFYCLR